MAMLLEVHFEKQDLMNAYINEIYLGQDGSRAIHGFGLASQFYFGKPLAELQLHEMALLVAIVRGPSYYDPRRHPKRVRDAARSGAEADGASTGSSTTRPRKQAAQAATRHRQRRHAGRRLLPGVPRSRAAHAAPRLSRGRSDRSGTEDFLDAESAGAEPSREGADAGARPSRQGAQEQDAKHSSKASSSSPRRRTAK